MRATRVALGVFVVGLVLPLADVAAYNPDDFDPAYLRAVQQAQLPDQNPHSTQLDVVTDTSGDIIWQNPLDKPNSPLLMSAFTDFAGYDRYYPAQPAPGPSGTTYRPELWTTLAGKLQSRLQNVPVQNIPLRTKQLLGMPSGHKGNRVVEIWTYRESLFRPMGDTDITNPNSTTDPHNPAQYNLGGYDQYKPFESWWTSQMGTYTGYTPYPWSQLGYTWDWGNPQTVVGMTEFILKAHDERNPGQMAINWAQVDGVYSLLSYVYYDRATGNFHVTGDCDTIWAGLRYTPQGNQVLIDAGATVYEGITVSSGGYHIINHGTLLGPGQNLDYSYRDNVVEFEHGGTLSNTGLIDSQHTAVYGSLTAAEKVTVNNSGTIRGARYSVHTGDGNDDIINTGTGLLQGDVDTGGGDDVVQSSATIAGNIQTGGGDDAVRLQGGLVTGTIDGGAGNNSIYFEPTLNGTVRCDGDINGFQQFYFMRGSLYLNGNVDAGRGDLTIAETVRLYGNGTYFGNLINYGQIHPGNSIGIVHVEGDYHQTSTGRLVMELYKPLSSVLQSDRLVVSGTTTLDAEGKIELRHIRGSRDAFRAMDRFVLINSTGDVTSNLTDDDITLHSDFLGFSRDWAEVRPVDPVRNVFSVVAYRKTTFEQAAIDENRALAHALDEDVNQMSGDTAVLLNELLWSTTSEFNAAASQMTPTPYFSMYASATRTAQFMAESMADYLRTRRDGRVLPGLAAIGPSSPVESDFTGFPSTAPRTEGGPLIDMLIRQQSPNERMVFAKPFGLFYSERTAGERDGFRANTGGVQVGIDQMASDGKIFGLGLGYAGTDMAFRDRPGGGTINHLRVGPYASWYSEQAFVDTALTWGYHDNDVYRSVVFTNGSGLYAESLDSSFAANDISFYIGGGYDMRFEIVSIAPTASLQYIYYNQSRFTEHGGPAALEIASENANSLRSELGVRLTRTWIRGSATIIPELFTGWGHEFLADPSLNARLAGGNTWFATDRGGLLRDSVYYGAALAVTRMGNTLYLRYKGEAAGGGQFHAVDAGLALSY